MNVYDLDLNLLWVFEAILEEGTVTAAAKRLGRTQPAVSNALARLRESVGDPLFVRVGRAMQPTPRAEALAPLVLAALEQVKRIASPPGFDPATQAHTFRICAPDYATMTVLPPLCAEVRRLAPAVDLRFIAAEDKPRTLDKLRSGDIDMALGVFGEPVAGLRYVDVVQERFVVVARRDHPALREERVSLDTFAALPHVLVSVNGDVRGVVDARLEAAGLRRRVVLTVPHFAAVPFVVGATDMIATLSRRTATLLGDTAGLVMLPCPLPLEPYALQMVYSLRLDHDPAHMWLRERVVEVTRAL